MEKDSQTGLYDIQHVPKKRGLVQIAPCNVMELPFVDQSFDVIVDKGVADCLWLADNMEDTNNLEDEQEEQLGLENIAQYQREVYRLLKPDGRWCIFSGYGLVAEDDDESALNHESCMGSHMRLSYDFDSELQVYFYELMKQVKPDGARR